MTISFNQLLGRVALVAQRPVPVVVKLFRGRFVGPYVSGFFTGGSEIAVSVN